MVVGAESRDCLSVFGERTREYTRDDAAVRGDLRRARANLCTVLHFHLRAPGIYAHDGTIVFENI